MKQLVPFYIFIFISFSIFGQIKDLPKNLDFNTYGIFRAHLAVFDGEAEIRISGESFTLEKGQIIIMPADDPHAVLAPTRFKMLLTMIK